MYKGSDQQKLLEYDFMTNNHLKKVVVAVTSDSHRHFWFPDFSIGSFKFFYVPRLELEPQSLNCTVAHVPLDAP
jgi:hypothetical protein